MKRTLHVPLVPILLALTFFPVGCILPGKHDSSAPPPDAAEVTREKLEHTKKLIAEYNAGHGHFPKSMSDLSWVNGGEKFEDAWGNEIGYSVSRDKTVRLWSFGADKELGGTGDNADLFITFNVLDVTPSMAEKAAAPKKRWL
ncbi:MAG TPA: hypothetical protein DEB39_01665 [Planctomycetaceae bacterium]|nr:hypothetical protein [Planctomycetaceae bacterium]